MSALLSEVMEVVAQLLRGSAAEIQTQASLEQLHFDSPAVVELCAVLHERFGVEIDEQELSLQMTGEDLARLVSDRLGSGADRLNSR